MKDTLRDQDMVKILPESSKARERMPILPDVQPRRRQASSRGNAEYEQMYDVSSKDKRVPVPRLDIHWCRKVTQRQIKRVTRLLLIEHFCGTSISMVPPGFNSFSPRYERKDFVTDL